MRDSTSRALGRDSGSGIPSGMGAWCSRPSSVSWNEAIIERIGRPSW
ncbi:hypothetical protein BC477_14900 [Clavibacter michiganensis subsp. michiganensis]|nr:hypothetical protein BC477_14900 [Clavibacter michiganensis subsp. michiganensis]